ncbi:MAG: cupin domain-containing protein [Saprospirales bacterium]|nr:cupin domain-containing protein [Saprospirales bacterium]
MNTVPLPKTIQNTLGEKLIFNSIEMEGGEEKVIVENVVQPGAGPAMHVHFKQDESLTVVKGKMGVEIMGKEPTYLEAGESATFLRGVPHRFWNAGEEPLECTGWIKPANSVVFFLSALYDAQNKSGSEQPEVFDGSYLITRYKTEYDVFTIPVFVKKVIMPITVFFGKLLGKYKHFEGAPEPLR